MKKIVYNISLALATLCAVSCSEVGELGDTTPGGVLPPNGEIAFTRVDINSYVDDELTTDNIDNFGIFVEPESYIGTYIYSNVKVENINGEWCSYNMLFWNNLNDKTIFAAYSPYNKDLTLNSATALKTAMSSIYNNGFIKADQSTLANYTASDLLYAYGWAAPNAVDKYSGDISYTSEGFIKTTFAHQCTMIVFEIELSPEYYTLEAGYPKATLTEVLSGGNRSTQSYVTVGEPKDNMCRDITIKTIIEPRTILSNESLSLVVQTTSTSTSTWTSSQMPTCFAAGKVYTVSGLTLGDGIMTGGNGFTVGGWDSTPTDKDITTDFPIL